MEFFGTKGHRTHRRFVRYGEHHGGSSKTATQRMVSEIAFAQNACSASEIKLNCFMASYSGNIS